MWICFYHVQTNYGSYLSPIWEDFASIWVILKLTGAGPKSPKRSNAGGSGSDQNPDRKSREPSPDRANNRVDADVVTPHLVSDMYSQTARRGAKTRGDVTKARCFSCSSQHMCKFVYFCISYSLQSPRTKLFVLPIRASFDDIHFMNNVVCFLKSLWLRSSVYHEDILGTWHPL